MNEYLKLGQFDKYLDLYLKFNENKFDPTILMIIKLLNSQNKKLKTLENKNLQLEKEIFTLNNSLLINDIKNKISKWKNDFIYIATITTPLNTKKGEAFESESFEAFGLNFTANTNLNKDSIDKIISEYTELIGYGSSAFKQVDYIPVHINKENNESVFKIVIGIRKLQIEFK
ncbi:hypothetical protein ABK040_000472 [Willaertia magna]